MRVLVVGGGGREHALCGALAVSPLVETLFAAPGNPGIAELATLVPVAATDVDGLAGFAERESVDLTVVGPEAPLVAGLADKLQVRGLAVFGPSRAGARLEGSKAWARRLCERASIPAPRSREFRDVVAARAYLDGLGEPPFVVKADGLAAGKGVTVAENRVEADRALEECLVRRSFGEAGATVLIEEYLEGWEVSAMALTDGRTVLPLALAHDYKRALDGDLGPNTGGMGAFSPLPEIDPAMDGRIVQEVLEPTVRALAADGVPYSGVLYAGLMVTGEGPKVLEFNCRFGDPETQVVLPRLRSDLADLALACANGDLGGRELDWSQEACTGVVLASAGYPGSAETGLPIEGLEDAAAMDGVMVFHAGTAVREGRVVTAGGRVLTVSALGADPAAAAARAYGACGRIRFEGKTFRSDIASGSPASKGA